MSQINPISETFLGTSNSVYNLLYPGIINGPFSSNVLVNSVLQVAASEYNILANTLIFYTGKPGANIVVQHYTSDNATVNLTNLIELSVKTSPGTGANAFGTVNVAGQGDLIADTANDTLTIVAGSGIILTTDAPNDRLTIAATGGSAIDQYARDKANGAVQLGYPSINVASNATLVSATTNTNTLILIQGTGIILTPNAANHSIAITASGGSAVDQYARDKANGAVQLGYPRINVAANATLVAATTNNDILILVQGNGIVLVSNTANHTISISANLSNTAPINYNPVTGNISHANSTVLDPGSLHGGSTQVARFITDSQGHITSVTNTGITLNATNIVSGILVPARGGTGLNVQAVSVNGGLLIGNTVNQGFDLNTIANTGTGGILITNGQGTITLGANVIWMRGNLSAVTPITYTAANGGITHAGSGVTATGYGTATQIPVFVVNETGHLTSVTNTAIAGLDAGVITTGSLTVPRGGTGLTPTIANGALLIGNTVNSGFDLNTIANTGTGGILITNGQGTITLAANVIWMRGNIGAVAPITYTSSNGNFTHDGSGVTATGYGSANTIPVLVVNATGHTTSVVNTNTTMSATIHQQSMSRISLGF